MKDLDKNVIYDLSDLNREERSELFDYLLSVDESNCDKTIEKDSILEVILKNRIIAIEETISELEIELFHNKNLNDFIKTELMKEVIFINRQSDVLNEVLKDYEIEKLKQQCEN